MSTVDAVCACFDLDLLVAWISNLFSQSFVQLKEYSETKFIVGLFMLWYFYTPVEVKSKYTQVTFIKGDIPTDLTDNSRRDKFIREFQNSVNFYPIAHCEIECNSTYCS